MNQKDAGEKSSASFLNAVNDCVIYPPQVKAPGAQLPALELLELAEPEAPIVKDATFDNFFFVFTLSHFGQAGSLSASEKRRFISNSSPHLVQRNSYKGMVDFL